MTAKPSPPFASNRQRSVALRQGKPPAGAKQETPAILPTVRSGAGPNRALCCVGCGHVVTHQRSRIDVAGNHEHTCVNPAGYRYRIACFRTAPGTIGVGDWSGFYSWFSGHLWQAACCIGCTMHLGWGFEPERNPSPESQFHGLIRNRLREQSPPAPHR